MSKDDAISKMNNSTLIDKVFCNFFINIEKMSETTYYQRNKYVIIKRAKDYYDNETKKD